MSNRVPEGGRGEIQTVALVSLGCPKNLVDSEKMLGLLAEGGLIPTADEEKADAIVINTCGFLEASKEESVGEIQRAAERRRKGKKKQRLVVAGCLVQRHRAKLLEWCPEIDALIGVFDRDRIVEAVKGEKANGARGRAAGADGPVYSSIAGTAAVARREREGEIKKGLHPHPTLSLREGEGKTPQALPGVLPGGGYFESDGSRLRLTPRHYAYLRISEGCNQNCAFCTIPSIRGKMRSKPVGAIVAEARELVEDGAFELNLIGQDTTSYGTDIGYGGGLAGMLRELDQSVSAEGAWLRLMYAYPSCFTDEMIAAVAELPRVVKYIDIPLQHISDVVLERMRRNTSRKLIETLLGKLRKTVKGIAIRTTFISGYPGETRAQHKELVKFVREFGFEAMGVFAYSPEPGTVAGSLYGRGEAVAEEEVAARVEELMLAQQEVSFARNEEAAKKQVEMDVLIDGAAKHGEAMIQGGRKEEATPSPCPLPQRGRGENHTATSKRTSGRTSEGGKLYSGRSYAQAPQIDGVTYVQAKEELAAGEVVRCRVVDASGYDLVAQPAGEVGLKARLAVLN
ncbi:MAG: 30S ribosomal protein S12 methylthiotransferase RimO [Phycisphaeraceae bacterium]|nr:30S ribosomal protein S12 methylthiotransferase RimO [Phycisphaeraceae bacterium]